MELDNKAEQSHVAEISISYIFKETLQKFLTINAKNLCNKCTVAMYNYWQWKLLKVRGATSGTDPGFSERGV